MDQVTAVPAQEAVQINTVPNMVAIAEVNPINPVTANVLPKFTQLLADRVNQLKDMFGLIMQARMNVEQKPEQQAPATVEDLTAISSQVQGSTEAVINFDNTLLDALDQWTSAVTMAFMENNKQKDQIRKVIDDSNKDTTRHLDRRMGS